MSPYLLGGLICGALCSIVNISIAASRKKTPVLSQSIELVISAVGASGGMKICGLVISGKLSAALKTSPIPLSEDDLIYIFLGGIALIWVSFESIIRRLR
jgi:hypothetical protein